MRITADWQPVVDELLGRSAAFDNAIREGFARASREIADTFKDGQMSGRDTGQNIFLNRRTGRLYESVQSTTEVMDASVTGVVFNAGADYIDAHQNALGHNPKRLFLDEYFESVGAEKYSDVVEDALSEFAK